MESDLQPRMSRMQVRVPTSATPPATICYRLIYTYHKSNTYFDLWTTYFAGYIPLSPFISPYFCGLKPHFPPIDIGSCTSNKTKHLCQAGDAAMRAFKLLLFGCLSDHQRGGGYWDKQKMAIFTRGKRWKHVGFVDLYQCTWQKNNDIVTFTYMETKTWYLTPEDIHLSFG